MSEPKGLFSNILHWAGQAQDMVLVFLMSFIAILVLARLF